MLQSLIGSVFAAYKPKREAKYRAMEYQRLETTPFLHGSEYLNELLEGAETKRECECILQHLYNHQEVGVLDIESYKTIESKIVDAYRRD